MKTALILILPILFPAFGQDREAEVDGLVFNRTKILESEGGTPLEPGAVGVAGVEVNFQLHVPVASHSTVPLAKGKTDENGRIKMRLVLPDLPGDRDSYHIKGVAGYGGAQYPFQVSRDGKFQVAVYESTPDPAEVRVLSHRIFLVPSEGAPGSITVIERMKVLNKGPRAFRGVEHKDGMGQGFVATIRATGSPHEVIARMGRIGTPLVIMDLGSEMAAVLGPIPPTGSEGEDLSIQYHMELGEVARGAITRGIIARTEEIRVFYPEADFGVDLPDGFSEAEDASEEAGAAGFVVRKKVGLSPGEELEVGVDFGSSRIYWVMGSFGAAFLIALLLAFAGASRGDKAVEPGAGAEPIARRIARLDIRNARGEIDPASYGREREALLREAMAGKALDLSRGAPSLDPEVERLMDRIGSLTRSGGDAAVKQGKRQAYLEEIYETLRRQRERGSPKARSADD